MSAPVGADRLVERHSEAAADHGLYWLVSNLAASAPLALVIDDAHWSDSASLRFVLYLTRRLEGLPVLMVLAARPGDGAAERRLLDLVATEPVSTTVTLAPLTERGAAELVQTRLGSALPAELASACHEVTGGTPFFLKEAAGALLDAGSRLDGTAAAHIRSLVPRTVARSLLVELGGAELAAGSHGAAAEHLSEALSRQLEPADRARAALALSGALVVTDGYPTAIELLRDEAARLGGEPQLRLDVEATALSLYVSELARDAQRRMREYAALRGETPAERLALATAALAIGFDPRSRATETVPISLRALGDGALIAEHGADSPPFGNACYTLLFAEDVEDYNRELEFALADARAPGIGVRVRHRVARRSDGGAATRAGWWPRTTGITPRR